MENGTCPRICLAAIIGSLLLYYPLEYLTPGWLRELLGIFLACAIAVFLTWCGASCIIERRRRQT